MTAAHVRCFWNRPLGHRWVFEHKGRLHVKRCQDCGRGKGLGMPPSATDVGLTHRGGVSDVGGFGGGDG
jgi:hypothetical protein